MQSETAHVIGQLAAPVVMISAAGLLCLALFNRLAAVVARSRAFAAERVHLLRSLDHPASGAVGASLDRLRLEALESHASGVLKRAVLIRAALQSLLAGVLLMLASSGAIGLSLASPRFWSLALWAFGLGLLAMGGGVVLVMAELSRALHDVKLEDRVLRRFSDLTEPSASNSP
ncbi:MAG TPA: DUF2721 domain-containing protein [Phycisphaerales bacterium]|nr:DUF2721 domain-containing protein [Phycisphaerales bacterium]